jgi:hypothetical protein
MKIPLLFIIILFSLICPDRIATNRQVQTLSENNAIEGFDTSIRQNVRIVFYNVENLYDPFNDTLTMDDEFTNSGSRHWGYSKFREKVNHVAKTFLAIGEFYPPAVIGLCEVENRYVLRTLVNDSPLKRFKYRYIHHDSPDPRGIDVALIYRPDNFIVADWKAVEIRYPFDTLSRTREILIVKGALFSSDTVFFIVNHWPSRRGGAISSQPRRNFVASLLK